jgi:hypothetical protein
MAQTSTDNQSPLEIINTQALLTCEMIAKIIGRSRYTAFRLMKGPLADKARIIGRTWYIETDIFMKHFRSGKFTA